MSTFSFTISASAVDALKGDSPGTNSSFQAVADRGLSRQTNNKVLTAKFGDGYEQRVKDGINTKMDMFNITFNNRTASSINLLAAFFDDRSGKNFDFTVTELTGDNTMKVVCENYTIQYIREEYHSLQTSLRRVYEP